jgi:hypothetical protein
MNSEDTTAKRYVCKLWSLLIVTDVKKQHVRKSVLQNG